MRLPRLDPQAEPLRALLAIGDGFGLDAYMLSVEARLLAEALDRARGDRAEAVRLLGVSVRSLRYLLGKHGGTGDKN